MCVASSTSADIDRLQPVLNLDGYGSERLVVASKSKGFLAFPFRGEHRVDGSTYTVELRCMNAAEGSKTSQGQMNSAPYSRAGSLNAVEHEDRQWAEWPPLDLRDPLHPSVVYNPDWA